MGNLEKRPEALPKETQRYILKVEKAYTEILNSLNIFGSVNS